MEHADLDGLIDQAARDQPARRTDAAPPEEAPPGAARPDRPAGGGARSAQNPRERSADEPRPRPSRRRAFAAATARCRARPTRAHVEREVQLRMALGRGARDRGRAARWWSRPAPASARPSPTWCRRCFSGERVLRQHRHQDPAGPAVPARPAAAARGAAAAGAPGAAQGPRQLPVPAPAGAGAPGRRSCPTAGPCARWPRSSSGRRPRAPATWPSCRAWTSARRVIPLVTSTRENCLGSECPKFRALPRRCKARREAHGGRRGGGQPPPVLRRPGGARHRHGRTAAERRGRDLRRGAPAHRDRRAVPRHARSAPARCSTSRATCSAPACSRRAAWRPGRSCAAALRARRARPAPGRGRAAARRARHAQAALGRARRAGATSPTRWPALAERCAGARARGARRRSARSRPTSCACTSAPRQLAQRWRSASPQPAADGQVRWIDVAPQQVRLVESPLDIREAVQRADGSARAARPGSSPRPRSATTRACAGSPNRPAWTTPRCCGSAARSTMPRRRGCTCRAASRSPTSRATPSAVARLAARCARALGGRTMVLTTTLRALRAIGEALQRRVRAQRRRASRCWCRASGPSAQLMERFLGASRGCVLVGSQSFWEGIDVPGDALQWW